MRWLEGLNELISQRSIIFSIFSSSAPAVTFKCSRKRNKLRFCSVMLLKAKTTLTRVCLWLSCKLKKVTWFWEILSKFFLTLQTVGFSMKTAANLWLSCLIKFLSKMVKKWINGERLDPTSHRVKKMWLLLATWARTATLRGLKFCLINGALKIKILKQSIQDGSVSLKRI